MGETSTLGLTLAARLGFTLASGLAVEAFWRHAIVNLSPDALRRPAGA